MEEVENKRPVLNILVVGFHHKLGCQVEFSYPPLMEGTTGKEGECPSGWKYLSTLALPDGSHNFTEDTVFFNLPSLIEPSESVYGVSCYRQISVSKLKIRTADVTRSTVQKSVCCLTRAPIYAYIEVKLALIADAFFEQGDFSNTELLVRAYQELNASLLNDDNFLCLRRRSHQQQRPSSIGIQQSTMKPLSDGRHHHLYFGLWLREIVLTWRHKLLQLLKLFLLQRRTIFYGSPVRQMGVLILGISSLIPRLLERGFQEVTCVRTSRPLSPMPDYTETLKAANQESTEEEEEKSQRTQSTQSRTTFKEDCVQVEQIASSSSSIPSEQSAPHNDGGESEENSRGTSTTILDRVDSYEESSINDIRITGQNTNSSNSNSNSNNSINTKEATSESNSTNMLMTLAAINPDEYRAPLSIFASGNLCLPYLSLPYMDLLTDPSVLSYVIGTSNVLFQQKRHLSDVLVDIENVTLEINDAELRKQLVLTTEDLRFMDYLLKHVQSPKEEDGEGSELWIRKQFQGYLLALLKATVAANSEGLLVSSGGGGGGGCGDQQWSSPPNQEHQHLHLNNNNNTNSNNNKCLEHFNACFIQAFRKTQCFQEWFDVRPEREFFSRLPNGGHPFASGATLSVADMKLKLTQTMQSTESGRKLNQAVNTTSRAVGGAISHAKDAFSNWWSAFTASSSPPISFSSSSSVNNILNSPSNDLTKEGEEEREDENSHNLKLDGEKEEESTNSSILTTLLLNNRHIELAKEVEEVELEEEAKQVLEKNCDDGAKSSTMNRMNIPNNLDANKTTTKQMTKVSSSTGNRYQNSDVYIV